jgi:tetratricopeptide (TPR) repeat protein
MNIANEILEAETESPIALSQADTYFRKALMLRPRDEALLTEQTQVTERFKERLFQHYIEVAKETVLGQEDSLLALETAIEYLDNALLLKPNDPETVIERNLAISYLEAQIDFEEGSIYDVISKLEYVYDISPDYANGTALQILYESYMQRGEIRSATGEYGQALEDYQRAVELSINADNPILKLYLSKVQVAEIQGILSDYELACDNYREAAELIDLLLLLEDEDQNSAFLLKEAERYADIEWYRTAYRLYRRVMPATDIILDIAEIIIIKEGDYLANLANIYGTTVEEILELNALPNAGNIKLGQEIKIPGLKGLKEIND